MKISKIKISDFHQFKNLTIDLTYPKGHEKEGKPLDKVCFIGQSGTGKTKLLELIPKFVAGYNTPLLNKIGTESVLNVVEMNMVFGDRNEYSVRIYFEKDEKKEAGFTRLWSDTLNKGNRMEFKEFFAFFKDEWTQKSATKVIYFPANLNYEIDVENEGKLNLNTKLIIDFSKEKVSTVWSVVLEKIKLYQEQEIKIKLELFNQLEQDLEELNSLNDVEKAFSIIKEWKKNVFNPVQDVAKNCLNELLKSFNLRVKTKLDFKSKEDIGFIKIEDFEGNEIPNGLWSTGTKQIILSSLPLYLLKPRNTIILFDEPEHSLYPDMQRLVVDYYASLTDNCQFFYSTHSPIIASNFEPWEIVELKFGKNGQVYRELYFQGENHIDNYKWNPKYMRWDDILQRIFDLESDGSPLRREKLDELARLNVKLKKLEKKENTDTDEARSVLKDIEKLSKELSYWD